MVKLKIAMSHPMREQLISIVRNLKDFEIEKDSIRKIQKNKKEWKKAKTFESFESHLNWKNNSNLITIIQRKIGLINIKKYNSDSAEIILANNAFLISNKPYITYLEKAPAIFGYTSKVYNSPIGKILLINRLKDKKLLLILFRTKTAMKGFIETFKKNKKIKKLLKQKAIYYYPPLEIKKKITLERFKNPKEVIFFFNSSSFILKGGYQLVRAFEKLEKEYSNVKLVLLTKKSTIDSESFKKISKNKKISFYEPNYTQEEVILNFYLKSHIFIYPTYSDSFSMAINEAIQTNMPIITSDFFSIPERIIDRQTGFLFKSPYKNYDKNFVIKNEHFGDYPGILKEIYYDSKYNKLKHVEEFLYEKMKFFTKNPYKIYTFAKKVNEFSKKELNYKQQKERINKIIMDSYKKYQKGTK